MRPEIRHINRQPINNSLRIERAVVTGTAGVAFVRLIINRDVKLPLRRRRNTGGP